MWLLLQIGGPFRGYPYNSSPTVRGLLYSFGHGHDALGKRHPDPRGSIHGFWLASLGLDLRSRAMDDKATIDEAFVRLRPFAPEMTARQLDLP